MAVAHGSEHRLAIAKETTFATAPGSGWYQVPVVSGGIEGGWATVPDDVPEGFVPKSPYRDVQEPSGSFDVPVDTEALGFWLLGLLGNPASVDNLDGTWTHTFGGANTPLELPTFSLEHRHTDVSVYRLATGCAVNSVRLSWEPRGLATASVELLAASSSITATAASGSPAAVAGTRIRQAVGNVQKDGVDLARVLSAEISIANNLTRDFYVDASDKAGAIIRDGRMESTGTITVRIADTTLLDLVDTGATFTFDLQWNVSATEYVRLTLPNVRLDRHGADIRGPGGIEARLDLVSDGAPTFELRNTRTAY